MKKFILNSILFLGLILVCNTLVYLFAQDVYHESYNEVPDKSFRSFIFADSYGLAIGESGEDYGVYNFSAASESYFDIQRKISYLIRNNYQIDKVYLAVDNHTLSPNRKQMNNLDRSVCFSSKGDFDTTYDYLKNRYIRYYGAIFRPSIRALLRSYLFQKVRTFIKGEPEVEIDGSEWRHLTDAQRNSEAEAIVEIQFPSGDSSDKLEKTLEDIIGLSKEHGFELVGVKLPVSASYSKALNNANYGADKLFAAHGIPVLNFKRKYLERDDFFADPNHLNEIGGEVFTKLLLTK